MIKTHYASIPGSKIGRDNRASFFLKTSVSGNPEPGNYNKPGFAHVNHQPKFSFSKSSRPEARKRGPPGPGEYEPAQPMGRGVPKYSMPGRGIDRRPKTGKDAPSCDAY